MVIVALLAGGALAYVWKWLNTPIPLEAGSSMELQVLSGESVRDVAGKLQSAGWLKHPEPWIAYSRYQGLATRIQAGNYRLLSGQTPLEVLDALVRGEVILQSLTVVEGSTYGELRKQLRDEATVANTVAELSEAELIRLLGLKNTHSLEGWFFPDTLRYAAGTSDIELLRQGLQRMQSVLAEEWAKRAEELPYESAYDALIMASIVEKETGKPEERSQIAGVFVRRLQLGMRLQTDPTVIYGLGENFDGNLRRSDLRTDTPYNTYTRNGLPPTPIALPGREAIRAALHPESGDALYFVAKGDGSHVFSKSLQEHEQAVREYQIQRRRQNYRSAP